MREQTIIDLDHSCQEWNSESPLQRRRVFYLPRIELGHIPCRYMVKEYQGFLCTLVSNYIESLPKHTNSVIAFFSYNNPIKSTYEEAPYKSHNQIIMHLTKGGTLGLPENGYLDSFMTFLRMVSCRSSKPSPKSIIHKIRIPLRLSTLMIS